MRYPLLDALRGLAAAWVFAHHLVYSATPEQPAWAGVLRLGYFGVPMFFVVSGYCLAAAGRRAVRVGDGPGRFLRRRLVRILPPFWAAVGVAVAAYAGLAAFGPSPAFEYPAYLRTAWASLTVREWAGLLTLTAAFEPTGDLPWHHYAAVNQAFWTLAVEVQFYLVVTLAVAAGRWFWPVLAVVTGACLPFTLDPVAYRSGWFVPHWAFFALGLGLYAALERRGWQPVAGRWPTALVAAAGTMMADGLGRAPLLPDGSPAMVAAELEFAAGFALALAALWVPNRGANLGPAVGYLSASSYSLYLLHVPLMFVVGSAVQAVAAPGSPGYTLVVMLGVWAAVAPFHLWVERPCLATPKPDAGTR